RSGRSGRAGSTTSRSSDGKTRRVSLIGFSILFALASGWAVVLLLGGLRWRQATRVLQAGLDASRQPIVAAIGESRDGADWSGLPPPVRRYLEVALGETRFRVAEARLTHTGTFNMSEAGENWRSFTSDQR